MVPVFQCALLCQPLLRCCSICNFHGVPMCIILTSAIVTVFQSCLREPEDASRLKHVLSKPDDVLESISCSQYIVPSQFCLRVGNPIPSNLTVEIHSWCNVKRDDRSTCWSEKEVGAIAIRFPHLMLDDLVASDYVPSWRCLVTGPAHHCHLSIRQVSRL